MSAIRHRQVQVVSVAVLPGARTVEVISCGDVQHAYRNNTGFRKQSSKLRRLTVARYGVKLRNHCPIYSRYPEDS